MSSYLVLQFQGFLKKKYLQKWNRASCRNYTCYVFWIYTSTSIGHYSLKSILKNLCPLENICLLSSTILQLSFDMYLSEWWLLLCYLSICSGQMQYSLSSVADQCTFTLLLVYFFQNLKFWGFLWLLSQFFF